MLAVDPLEPTLKVSVLVGFFVISNTFLSFFGKISLQKNKNTQLKFVLYNYSNHDIHHDIKWKMIFWRGFTIYFLKIDHTFQTKKTQNVLP